MPNPLTHTTVPRHTLGTHALASATRTLMRQCFPYLQPEEPAR